MVTVRLRVYTVFFISLVGQQFKIIHRNYVVQVALAVCRSHDEIVDYRNRFMHICVSAFLHIECHEIGISLPELGIIHY